jgi:Dockerin type I domain
MKKCFSFIVIILLLTTGIVEAKRIRTSTFSPCDTCYGWLCGTGLYDSSFVNDETSNLEIFFSAKAMNNACEGGGLAVAIALNDFEGDYPDSAKFTVRMNNLSDTPIYKLNNQGICPPLEPGDSVTLSFVYPFGTFTMDCFDVFGVDPLIYSTDSSNACDFINMSIGFYYAFYICGDANDDSTVNVSDAVYIVNYVFLGGTAPTPVESGDANCDLDTNVSDVVSIINYVFTGGNAPCEPF